MYLFTGARGSSVVDDGGSFGERARSIVNDPTKATIDVSDRSMQAPLKKALLGPLFFIRSCETFLSS